MKEIQVHIGKRYKTAKATLAGVLIGDGTGGAVKSVNGKTGDVTLTPEDVGALSAEIKVPSKVSELVNDSRFMSDEEVVAKINEAISGVAGGLKFEIVDEVPTGWGDGNTIYLVRSEDTDDNQHYDEYMFIESRGTWEKLGDTRVNLEPYYTGMKVDNLIYNVQKTIPTKISQLYNDAGYVKAEDIETGEATWDSIKGNIVYPIEEFIEWDGNTEGLDTWGSGAAIAYRVSDRVIRSEDFSKSGMTVTYENGTSIGIAASVVSDETDGKWYSSIYGVGCVFDSELAGLPAGIYFSAYNFSEAGMPRKLGPFVKENIKHELLSGYFENVGGKDVIKEEYLPPSVPREGMTVKSKTFTTVTSVYEWLEENFNKVLKAIMSAQGSAYSFVNMAKNNGSEGARYVFNLTNLYDMSGNVINYATYLVVIKPQSLEFTTGTYDVWEGTIDTSSLSCTTNDTRIFDDEILQSVGGEFTVFYID